MTVIGGKGLRKLLYCTSDWTKRLVVTPILDTASQIDESAGAIDIRLGTKFIVPQRASVAHLDVGDKDFNASFVEAVETVHVSYGASLTLHPGHFVLGSSLEYFRLPANLSGYVVSRSSWGRLGLIVATAIGIHPGFFGVLCLELSNSAEVPISLYPGLTIAQVFFHTVEPGTTEKRAESAYLGATEVELPSFSLQPEIGRLSRLSK